MDPSVSVYPKLEELKSKLPENVKRQFEKKFETLMHNLEPTAPNFHQVKEDGVFHLYQRKDEGFVTQKAHMESNHSIESLTPKWKDVDYRLKYDQIIEKVEIINKVNEHFAIIRSQIKGKFMVISPREFVTYNVYGWIDDKVKLDLTLDFR
jgi:hypothetical protein